MYHEEAKKKRKKERYTLATESAEKGREKN